MKNKSKVFRDFSIFNGDDEVFVDEKKFAVLVMFDTIGNGEGGSNVGFDNGFDVINHHVEW